MSWFRSLRKKVSGFRNMVFRRKRADSSPNKTEVFPNQERSQMIPLETFGAFWVKCRLNVLTHQYDPEDKALTVILTEHENGYDYPHEEDGTDFAETVLPGLFFDTVNIKSLSEDRLFSNRDLVYFERKMTNLTTNVALRCETLTISTRIEKFPCFVRFFQSVDSISGGMCCDYTSTDRCSQYVDLYEALDLMQHPQLQKITGAFFITKSGCEGIVPLFHRLDDLSLGPEFERGSRLEIWRNIRSIFKEFQRGHFDGQKKKCYIFYVTESDLYWENGSWKEIPELEGISSTKVWDYQFPSREHSTTNDERFLVQLIESNGTVAVCGFYAQLFSPTEPDCIHYDHSSNLRR